MSSIDRIRRHAVAHTLFRPTTLKGAVARLGFVQADHIRSPARAQDLILRHRVKGYRAGDLERRYPALDLEEDYLYAYGFLPRESSRLLHPRALTPPTDFERDVLEVVTDAEALHPRELEEHFGSERVINGWGSYSKATKQALERLHHRGLLRVTRREKGIRVYAPAAPIEDPLPPEERARRLLMVMARIFAPVPERSLQDAARHLRHALPGRVNTRALVRDLLKQGELESATVDDLLYLWPAGKVKLDEAPRTARLLAPFDPVIWDRRRFEHLWGWSYRFEAYTPAPKRVRGYYAMPLLWGEDVIGWGNANVVDGRLEVEIGFVDRAPRDRAFSRELNEEIGRMAEFLGVGAPSGPPQPRSVGAPNR